MLRSAMRAARILSRSSAITFMRWLMRSRLRIGMMMVSAVANAATAAAAMTMSCGCIAASMKSIMTAASPLCSRKPAQRTHANDLILEIDHLAHDEQAHGHPNCRKRQHELPGLRIPKEGDVIR